MFTEGVFHGAAHADHGGLRHLAHNDSRTTNCSQNFISDEEGRELETLAASVSHQCFFIAAA
eukprot:m.204201 g.204201  ORF g.204201 m.204201 type:complete len:62 (-) comp26020_c0_seq2:221-406(-)